MSIVKATTTELVSALDYGDDAGSGFENQSAADSSFPFMTLLQGLSPAVSDGKAKPGQWYNTVTEQAFERDTGFLFVPAATRHYFGEWTPRSDGGGFHGHMTADDPIVAQALKISTKYGKYTRTTDDGKVHDLVETFYVYGVLCDNDGNPESMVVIPFKSTMIKPYKTWNGRVKQMRPNPKAGQEGEPPMNRPPLFSNMVRITSRKDKNDKGEFFIPVLAGYDPRGTMESLIPRGHPAYEMAKAFKQLIDSGDAKIDYNRQSAQDDGGAGEAPF